MARVGALAAAVALALLGVAGAGGAATQQAPKRGGTLVIGTRTTSEPVCLNVFVEACGVPSLVGPLVLLGAFEVTPDASFRPDLVSRAEIVTKQPFTLVYHVRPEAEWSDGVPVTASDFAFTVRAQRAIRARLSAQDREDLARIRSVRALDAKTIRVVMQERFPDWRYLFQAVLPRHALAGQDLGSLLADRITHSGTGRPIGSGPFVLESWDRGRQLTFRRNPRYWGPHPAYLGRIVYRFLPPQDTAEALLRGEIDTIDPGPAVLQSEALELHRHDSPGVTVISTLGNSYEHFTIRMARGGHPALRLRGVRQALAHGIDRVEIARAIGDLTLARGSAREPLDNALLLANSPYYRPNWKGYRYQPERARRLLEQAGCQRGEDGIYICVGQRMSLRIAAPAGVERRELTARLAQAQLRRVGVDVRLVFAPPQTLFPEVLPSGEFDLILFAWIVGASTSGWESIFGCQGSGNYSGYCDRLVTRDLVQASRTLVRSRRLELLNRLDARLAKAVPILPLYQGTGLWAFRASLRGALVNPAGSWVWNAEDWWLDR